MKCGKLKRHPKEKQRKPKKKQGREIKNPNTSNETIEKEDGQELHNESPWSTNKDRLELFGLKLRLVWVR